MMEKNKRINLGKIYFIYLFLVLFLQIIGYSAKGSMVDTVWKAGVIVATLCYVIYKTGGRITRYIVIPILIYIIGQVMAWISFDLMSLQSLINLFVILAMTYFFMSVSVSANCFQRSDLNWFINAFIFLMIYAVIFNFITNPSSVLEALSNKSAYANMMSSFFDNKQTFGMFLFMGFIVSVWGYIINNKRFYIITAVIFFVNLFLCSSRTALFACVAFILMIALFSFKSNQKFSLHIIAAIAAVSVIVLLIPALRIFVSNVLLDTEDTMNARTNIWDYAFSALKGRHLFFGYGEGNSFKAMELAGYYANTHNGIIQVLITGGIIKLALYICVIIKSLMCIHRIKKFNATLSGIFLSTLISVCIFSMGEALVLLDSSAPCVAASILCIGFPLAVEDSYYEEIKDGR